MLIALHVVSGESSLAHIGPCFVSGKEVKTDLSKSFALSANRKMGQWLEGK